MKIISNDECYIQGKDILYISNYVPLVDKDILIKLNSLYTGSESYVKVCDKELIEFIKSCEFIVSFNYLFMINYYLLDQMALRLRIEISDILHEEDCISCDGDRVEFRERVKNKLKNKEYLLEQILCMMEYKKGLSKCNFPNIPNPCVDSIISGDMVASLSLDYDNILIHSINNSKFNLSSVSDFGPVAYRMFMHDRYGSDVDKVTLNQSVSLDKKYVSFNGNNLENIENNNSERRL